MFLTNTSFVIRRLYSEKDYQSIEKQKHVHTKIWQKAVGQSIYRVFFFHWYPPKKLKYEKPRLDESTLA